MIVRSILLALRDLRYELSLSLCAVLALASMLTPLLVLHGVHTGVVERLRDRLMSDPAVLVLMPAGSRGAGFDEAFLREISARPQTAFCVGRTRDVAAELQLHAADGKSLTVTLEASAHGDPLLGRHGIEVPKEDRDRPEMVLTATAAKKLGVRAGDELSATLGRRLSTGKFQRRQMHLRITGVLPPEASGMDTGFACMDLLNAIQDFRDGVTSPFLGFEGEKPPVRDRYYEGFRAYVHSLDEVEPLEAWFNSQGVLVKTRSRDIASIRNIDRTLSAVIWVIALASGAGFAAFMMSTVHASVRRKWKMLGMLRLLGFSRAGMLAYPMAQALTTGLLGVALSLAMYAVVALIIDTLFAAQTGGGAVCVVHAADMTAVALGVELLVACASLRVSLRASRIDPSTVIREV